MTGDIVDIGNSCDSEIAIASAAHTSPLCETCKEALDGYDLAISLRQAESLGHIFDDVKNEAEDGAKDGAIDRAKDEAQYGRLLLTSNKSLVVWAANGCHLCQNLLKLIPVKGIEAIENSETPSAAKGGDFKATLSYKQDLNLLMFLSSNGQLIPRTLELEFQEDGEDKILEDHKQNFSFLVDPNEDLSNLPGDIEANTGSETTFALVDMWVSECLSTHTCHVSWTGFETCFVPTYLIDVGDATPPKPRLCLGGESRNKGFRYVTLSQCWGSVQPLILTNNNLANMMDGFDYNKIPKTFQDAMLVVQRLQQRYLWIDSLCIIQDSIAHWLRESGAMGQVYSNSICNICATAAADGHGGLFYNRDPMKIKPVVAPIKDNDTYKLCTLYPVDFWKDGVQNTPLNQRAWVCQERLLSTCNLHFTAEQVFWECRAKTACETAPDHLSEAFIDAYIKKNISHYLSLTQQIPYDVPVWQRPSRFWDLVANLFASGDLTFATDKLVAISGLANQMCKITNDEYLAGLWRTNLIDQLLWLIVGENDREFPDPVNHGYVAPSWSWASTRGQIAGIYRPPDIKEVLIDIVDAQVELASDNTFGQVKAGHIIIKGKLARAVYRVTEGHTTNGFIPPALHIQVDDEWATSTTQFEEGKLIGAYYSMSRERVLSQGGVVYLLPCIKDKLEWPGRGKPGYDQLECLVLVETGRKPGEFYRCGSASVHAIKDDSKIQIVENGCRYFDSKSAESRLESSEDPERGLVYTVTII